MAHIIGMVERFIAWLQAFGTEKVEFCRHEDVATEWLEIEKVISE